MRAMVKWIAPPLAALSLLAGMAAFAASRSYAPPQQIGTVTSKALTEISGLAASRLVPGLWWVHNDSGGGPRLYAINSAGELRATFTVTGARNRDWEDMASGPGGDGTPALYIGDIGDNLSTREELIVYRVREPKVQAGVAAGATEAAEAFPFRYPDGQHDAEAMLVDPRSGRIYIITKARMSRCGVYRFPLPLRRGERVTLQAVAGETTGRIAEWRLVTGASAAPDGSRVVVRTYFSAFELARARGGAFESVFDSEPAPVKIPLERQGEAIAYARDGESIVTTSERLPAPIYRMALQP